MRRPPPALSALLNATIALVVPALLASAPASAQEEGDDDDPALTRWVFKGEFTSVLAQGNAESLTLGLGSTLRRRWDRDALRFEAGAVRAEATRFTRRAVGTPDAFDVEVDRDAETTAEVYFVRGRYDRDLNDRFFAFTGVDWLRNTPAGIESRFLLAVGGGNTWADRNNLRFSTSFAVTYTFQSDVVENPFLKTDFAGIRAGWEFFHQLTATTEFTSDLTADLNLDATDDMRADLTNAMTVDINDALALKPSLQILWRNQPSLTRVPLFTPGGTDTGDEVTTPLRKVDTFFRLALVLTL
jgi:putative salt-induced outer membrane protein YdiY